MDPIKNQYIGCVLGRCANRIENGTFALENEEYFLTKNDDCRHHLHGGVSKLIQLESNFILIIIFLT